MSTAILRKLGKTAWMEAGGHVNDSVLFLADYLLRFLRVAVLLGLWRVILAGRGPVSGMTLGAVLTYTLVSEIFAEQLYARTYIEYMLWEGCLINLLLRPMRLVPALVSTSLGRWLAGFVFCSAPLLVTAPMLGVDPLPASLAAGLMFMPSLLLAITLGLAVDFLFAALMVNLSAGPWIVAYIRDAATSLLSGSLLPLALLPWGLGRVFGWLPFASMASAPLRIYTGTGDPRLLMSVQAGWALVLWPLAAWTWRASREKLVSQGG